MGIEPTTIRYEAHALPTELRRQLRHLLIVVPNAEKGDVANLKEGGAGPVNGVEWNSNHNNNVDNNNNTHI